MSGSRSRSCSRSTCSTSGCALGRALRVPPNERHTALAELRWQHEQQRRAAREPRRWKPKCRLEILEQHDGDGGFGRFDVVVGVRSHVSEDGLQRGAERERHRKACCWKFEIRSRAVNGCRKAIIKPRNASEFKTPASRTIDAPPSTARASCGRVLNHSEWPALTLAPVTRAIVTKVTA
eukprot:5187555-Prymnesium_polylepis.1